jgi:hypothetical protein
MTPFPIPLTTPPDTTIYLVMMKRRTRRIRSERCAPFAFCKDGGKSKF